MCIPEFRNSETMKTHSSKISKLCNHKPKLNYLGAKVNPAICVDCGSPIKKGYILNNTASKGRLVSGSILKGLTGGKLYG